MLLKVSLRVKRVAVLNGVVSVAHRSEYVEMGIRVFVLRKRQQKSRLVRMAEV